MKINFKKSNVLLLAGALSLISCAPRDIEVVSKEEREFIQSRAGRPMAFSGSSSKSGIIEKSDFRVNDNALALLLLEKQAELLEVLSTAALERFEARGSYSVDAKAKGEAFEKTIIGARNKDLSLAGSDGLKTTLNSEWKFDFARETSDGASKIVLIDGFNKETRIALDRIQRADKNAMKIFANFNLSNGELKAFPIKDSKSFKLFYSADGLLNVAKDKMSAWPVTVKIELEVELADLLASEFKVTKVFSSIIVGEIKKKEIRLALAPEMNLSFKNDSCPRFIGSIQAVVPIFKKGQGDRPEFEKRSIVLDELEAIVDGGKYKSTNQTCGQRPTLDLSRLLQ